MPSAYAGRSTRYGRPSVRPDFFITLRESVGVRPDHSLERTTRPRAGSARLSAGNTLILKPAEQRPWWRCAQQSVLGWPPDGVINVVTGFGETAGTAIANHQTSIKWRSPARRSGEVDSEASASNLNSS
jgi:hypothetical protein